MRVGDLPMNISSADYEGIEIRSTGSPPIKGKGIGLKPLSFLRSSYPSAIRRPLRECSEC